MEEATNLEGAKKIYWYGSGLTRALEELSENGFYVSGEKNYVVDYSSTLSKETKSPETVSMRVYNSSFERVWERDYTLPYANSVFAITEVIVDEAGNTYLVGREYRGKGKPRGGSFNYVYHILVFTNNGTQVDDRKIELPGVYVTDLTMGVNARKQVMAVGFYSKTGKENTVNGTLALTIDSQSGAFVSQSMKEFDSDFIREGMTRKEEKKADRKESRGEDLDLLQFDLNTLFFSSDGGCVLLAEQRYITTRTITTPNPQGRGVSTQTITLYHADDVIAVKVNPEAEIVWNTKIPKSQVTRYTSALIGYAVSSCADDLILVYNELTRKINTVMAVTIRPNGEVQRDIIMENKQADLNLNPSNSSRVNDCRIMLYTSRGKTYQFHLLEKVR